MMTTTGMLSRRERLRGGNLLRYRGLAKGVTERGKMVKDTVRSLFKVKNLRQQRFPGHHETLTITTKE